MIISVMEMDVYMDLTALLLLIEGMCIVSSIKILTHCEYNKYPLQERFFKRFVENK